MSEQFTLEANGCRLSCSIIDGKPMVHTLVIAKDNYFKMRTIARLLDQRLKSMGYHRYFFIKDILAEGEWIARLLKRREVRLRYVIFEKVIENGSSTSSGSSGPRNLSGNGDDGCRSPEPDRKQEGEPVR